jgi:hypothetical protein
MKATILYGANDVRFEARAEPTIIEYAARAVRAATLASRMESNSMAKTFSSATFTFMAALRPCVAFYRS